MSRNLVSPEGDRQGEDPDNDLFASGTEEIVLNAIALTKDWMALLQRSVFCIPFRLSALCMLKNKDIGL